jgi:O-antigen/teichoic acid export membrane protein
MTEDPRRSHDPAPRLAGTRRRLRTSGVADGLWTATAAAGSKIQTLAALSIGGRMGNLEGLAIMVLATSTAILAASAADIGLSSQIVRAYASGGVRKRSDMLPAFAVRLGLCVPLAGAAAVVIWSVRSDISDPALWFGAIVFYALAFLSSMLITNMAYGLGRFRRGASLNGIVRAATIPALFALSLVVADPLWLLLALGIGELVIAALQYRQAPQQNPRTDGDPVGLGIRHSWRFGVGSLMNTLMNRSDTVIISGVASPQALGIYSVASQVENALTTVALIPAGAATTYAARNRDRGAAVSHRRIVTGTVALAYLAMAVPFFLFAEPLTEFVLGVTIDDITPVRILVFSGLLSCFGSVAMKILTGEGRQNAVAGIWMATAVVTVVAMATGAYLAGGVGAAIGAAARDTVFCVLTWVAVITGHRRAASAPARRAAV